jgi:hypothetical protein
MRMRDRCARAALLSALLFVVPNFYAHAHAHGISKLDRALPTALPTVIAPMSCEQECRDAGTRARTSCEEQRMPEPARSRCEETANASLEVCLRLCDE